VRHPGHALVRVAAAHDHREPPVSQLGPAGAAGPAMSAAATRAGAAIPRATLRPSRRGPRGVAPAGAEASAGRCEPRGRTPVRRSLASRAGGAR
jgi:hypothetical protein